MRKKGGSLSSSNVVKMVSPTEFVNLDKMFSNITIGGGKKTAKKGGSRASADVVKRVSPTAFSRLNGEFTNVIGGQRNAKALLNVNLNDATDKMMVYNKSGGKKRKAPEALKRKKRVQKGGDATATSWQSWIGELPTVITNSLNSIYNSSVNTVPPAHIATKPYVSLDTKPISPPQQMLARDSISVMGPIQKTNQIPMNSTYKGSNFSFGGGKK